MNDAKFEKAKKYMDEHDAEIKSIRQAADYVDMVTNISFVHSGRLSAFHP